MIVKAKHFLVEQNDKVVVWRFYNPPNNIWTSEIHLEFNDIVEDFYKDSEVRVGVITSAMPDVFILHFDVAKLVEMGCELNETGSCAELSAVQAQQGVYRCGPKVVIAAINANLSGGGLELAMACDFRFMAKNALASQSEVNVGILPGSGGTQRMTRLVGLPKAMELMLTGRQVSADEAERIGLITRAVSPLMLMSEVMNFAQAMANRPPLAIAYTKQCIYAAMDMPIKEGLEIEGRLFQELVKSPEAMERMKAYVSTGQPSPRQYIQMELEAVHKKWEACQRDIT